MKVFQIITLIVFSFAVLLLTFFINFDSQMNKFESTAHSKEALVSEYVDISSNFIDLMTIYGNRFFSHNTNIDSELYSLLKQDADGYNLDSIGGTKNEKVSGNLTGLGSIPENGLKKDEINLALNYGKYFNSFHERLPDIAWLYYTSENDFMNIYPWVSSKEFKYSVDLKSKEFYSFVKPKKNDLRQSTWTPVYLDAAGQGLVVTLSSPIYRDNTFIGVVSLDLTTARLGELIETSYQSYLVDIKDFIIAASSNTGFSQKKKEVFGDLLGLTNEDKNKLKNINQDITQCVGNYYIHTVDFPKTPWKMYFLIPVWNVIGVTLLYSSPMLVICFLLFLTVREVERRRRTEDKLHHSLEEIQAYHVLLENSAKHDFLTNTCNRRGLAEFFEAHQESAGTKGIPVAFIMGDIDEFKKFNDTYGHTAGDRILVEISNIMKKNVGENNVICRWGGEEFVILLLNKTYEKALQIAEKIRKEIETTTIEWADALQINATMTFGVAAHDLNETMQETISKADNALYAGKQRGRNMVMGYLEL